MRLGLGSYTYTWAVGTAGHPPHTPLTASSLVARAAAMGIRVVQLCDNLPLDQLSAPELAALPRQAAEARICLEVGTRGVTPEHLRASLRTAQQLHASLLRTLLDGPDHLPDLAEAERLLAAVLPEFAAAGVCLALENHDRFRARELAALVRRLGNEAVGICLDTANSFGALEGPETVVETLAPWTVSLHLKDFAVFRAGHQMGFTVEGRPAGQGRLDIPWLLQQLRRTGRDPNVILELWTPPEETLSDTIAKEQRWAEESLTYLRTLIPE